MYTCMRHLKQLYCSYIDRDYIISWDSIDIFRVHFHCNANKIAVCMKTKSEKTTGDQKAS